VEGQHHLSFGQERFWFLDRLAPGDPAGNVLSGRRISGPLDRDALVAALAAVVDRHPALRTVFVEGPGGTEQHIRPPSPFRLEFDDLRTARNQSVTVREIAAGLAAHRFDLTRDMPLRCRLIRVAENEYLLYGVFHHIAIDGWSLSVFYRDLLEFYAAASGGRPPVLPVLAADYRSWAARQRASVGPDHPGVRGWRAELAGLPESADLPADRPRPPVASHRGRCLTFTVEPALYGRLRQLAAEQGATTFMALLAALQVVVGRYTGAEEFAVGTPVAGRTEPATDEVVGLFVNTVPIRADLRGNPTVRRLLRRVRDRVLFALENQDVPFDHLAASPGQPPRLDRNPIFQVMLALNNTPPAPTSAAGLEFAPLDLDPGIARLDLTLNVGVAGEALLVDMYYATDLFDQPRMRRLIEHYRTVLAGMVAAPDDPIGALPMLTPAEHAQLAGWNDTGCAYPPGTLPELLRAAAARTPGAPALLTDGGALSFAELATRAARLGAALRRQGVGVDDVVGVRLPRGVDLVTALHGVHAAGAAYLPLEPDLPAERVATILAETGTRLVLGSGDQPPWPGVTTLDLDRLDLDGPDPEGGAPAGAAVPADALAYVIHTSGSTGRPKAIGVSHRAIVNRLRWMQEAFALTAADRLLQKTPASFDVSVWEFFWPLLNGAALVVAEPGGHRDTAYLAATIARHRVSVVHFVPSMLEAFLDEPAVSELTGLRTVVCSGEALSGALAVRCRATLPGAGLHNLYGPTEAAVDVSWHPCGAEPSGVPIGRPVANTRLTIRDRWLNELPVGVPGELFIGGVQLARGYLGRPDLTADRFRPDPDRAGERIYRTGDLARRLADGEIEFLGRTDHQIKLNGYRIELGEIESVLVRYPGVRAAAVLLAGTPARLTAYVVAAGDTHGDTDGDAELDGFLRERLPGYMVPARIVSLDRLPTTGNGKLDRTALLELAAPEQDGTASDWAPPVGAAEQAVAAAVGAVLGTARVGALDNFYALGGDSIRSLRLVARLRHAGYDLALADVLRSATIRELAGRLRQATGGPAGPVSAPFALMGPEDLNLLATRTGDR
jgi:amino acid adenylation domain-containing protein